TLSRQGVEIARRLGDPDTLGYALVGLATATWAPDVKEKAEVADEVARLANETGNAEQALLGNWLHHIVAMTYGGRLRAEALAAADRALAEELKQPSQQWYSTVRRCVWALLEGRFDEAEQLAEEALRRGERAIPWDAGCSYRLALFVLRREQGRLEEIETLL